MSEVTVTLPRLAVHNLLTLVDLRLGEIERLAVQHPNLPMRCPTTVSSYEAARKALAEAIDES